MLGALLMMLAMLVGMGREGRSSQFQPFCQKKFGNARADAAPPPPPPPPHPPGHDKSKRGKAFPRKKHRHEHTHTHEVVLPLDQVNEGT